MTVQEVKEKLGSVFIRYREYLLAEEKAEQFRDMISLPAPVDSSDAPRSESGGNATESKYIAALWYSEQADRKFRDYMIARQGAEMIISGVKSSDEREILTRKYIMFQKWEVIAEKMYMTPRNVHYLHGNALSRISETFH